MHLFSLYIDRFLWVLSGSSVSRGGGGGGVGEGAEPPTS